MGPLPRPPPTPQLPTPLSPQRCQPVVGLLVHPSTSLSQHPNVAARMSQHARVAVCMSQHARSLPAEQHARVAVCVSQHARSLPAEQHARVAVCVSQHARSLLAEQCRTLRMRSSEFSLPLAYLWDEDTYKIV